MNDLKYRNLLGESDYPLLLELNLSSRKADHNDEEVTVEDIAEALIHMDGFSQQEGVLIASLENIPVGYSRLGWYSSRPQTRLYYQISFLRQEFRSRDIWPEMIANNERYLRILSCGHPKVAESYFQAWASDNQKDWMSALESCGYQVVRRFNNMLYPLGKISIKDMPEGLVLRQVGLEQMHAVWEMLKEMNVGLFENVAEDWAEEKFPAWLSNPENNPRCWQVAWAGNQMAGMVLAHFDEKDNEKRNRKHGYTEHIYVRPAWRRRGLASALITKSLQSLKEYGITEAELGVDSENESAAFHLYESLGYKTYSVDSWYRKAMD